MGYSKYLSSRHDLCKELVNRLLKKYEYVSLLGNHIDGVGVKVDSNMTGIGETNERECGFVLKLFNGTNYSEYSFSEINEDNLDEIEKDVVEKTTLSKELLENHVSVEALKDEPLVKSFERKIEGKEYTVEEILGKLNALKEKMSSYSPEIIQVMAIYQRYNVSKMFISKNKDLNQSYSWAMVYTIPVARREEKMKMGYGIYAYNSEEKAFDEAEKNLESNCKLSIDLLDAGMIEPGEYDIITDPSITGLIAHEAFGHGVEMDMFVKNRALAKSYIGKYVASPLVNMHDGAAATLSCASYFFDDDGVLAHDTLIIKDGILQTGISDSLSALQLGTEPTGNGRRESYKRKAYTRMTNTFFSPGTDSLEDMIKSVKHGYYLCETDNGMEDPKNWNIQCVCQYGREIKDGKFTGKIVSPVCMTGYVPDLLKSISMVSSDFNVIGSGYCGKGHKEWVTVSDGGPCLKARCKLG